MKPSAARVVLFAAKASATLSTEGRVSRALAGSGLLVDRRVEALGDLPRVLAGVRGPVWLIRADCWPLSRTPVRTPPPSGTGRPLCALGAVRSAGGGQDAPEVGLWGEILRRSGGDIESELAARRGVPPLASVFLDEEVVEALVEALSAFALPEALREALVRVAARVVHFEPLDVAADVRPRVAEVVTSLQRGGAERIALDLASQLPAHGLTTCLVPLAGPSRAAFPVPTGVNVLNTAPRRPAAPERVAGLIRVLSVWGTDAVHCHLLEGDAIAALASAGFPVIVTLHNSRAGWPAGTTDLAAGDLRLIVACARAVEADARAAALPAPMRTVWNGVDPTAFALTPRASSAARAWRRRLGFGDHDLVLLAIANPRPQKRLERMPAVLAGVRERMRLLHTDRNVRLVIAGEAAGTTGAASLAALRAEAARHDLHAQVALVGSVADVATLLMAADVLVSTSAHEGLSLAQLEALAAGVPVVTTDTGGAREVGQVSTLLRTVPVEASIEMIARAVAEAVSMPPAQPPALPASFERERMVEGYARLLHRASSSPPSRGGGLMLVANNFSTGGAQSSARRLLLGLREEGERVRAAVLEEQEAYPTPGRRALLEAEVEVHVLRPRSGDPGESVRRLLDWMGPDAPEAVVFWNAIVEHKLLIADALFDLPLFDVSPGEMFYESLDRYFAHPRPGLPYRESSEYGARLAGVVVKYGAEADAARRRLGATVHVIPNGIEPTPRHEIEATMARRTGHGEPIVIGTAARLDPRKRVHELIDAVRLAAGRMPRFVLRVAGGPGRGEESYAGELRRRAEGLPVEWLGDLADTRPFLRTLDVFVLIAEPAGCPNASLEAMAEGLPVVATDRGGISEQIVEGETGRLVDPGDAAGFADALVALATEPQARERMGRAGRRRVEERFDLRKMVAAYRRVLLGR